MRVAITSLIVLAVCVALGAAWFGVTQGRQIADEAMNGARRSVKAFAEAVSAWADAGRIDRIHEVANLMLAGSYDEIAIRSGEQTLLHVSGPSAADKRLPSTQAASGTTAGLHRSGRNWTVHVSMPWAGSFGSSGSVLAAVNADHHAGRYAVARWETAGVALAGWILASLLCLTLLARWPISAPPDAATVEQPSPDIAINQRGRHVEILGSPVRLQPKPYELLCLLASEEGRVFGESEILESVWPDSDYANASDIRQCVYKARRALHTAHPGAGDCIVTEKGFGYRFQSRIASASEPRPIPTEPEHCLQEAG